MSMAKIKLTNSKNICITEEVCHYSSPKTGSNINYHKNTLMSSFMLQLHSPYMWSKSYELHRSESNTEINLERKKIFIGLRKSYHILKEKKANSNFPKYLKRESLVRRKQMKNIMSSFETDSQGYKHAAIYKTKSFKYTKLYKTSEKV